MRYNIVSSTERQIFRNIKDATSEQIRVKEDEQKLLSGKIDYSFPCSSQFYVFFTLLFPSHFYILYNVHHHLYMGSSQYPCLIPIPSSTTIALQLFPAIISAFTPSLLTTITPSPSPLLFLLYYLAHFFLFFFSFSFFQYPTLSTTFTTL